MVMEYAGTIIADVENAQHTSDPSSLATGNPLKGFLYACFLFSYEFLS